MSKSPSSQEIPVLVTIPVYNGESTISKTLNSLLNQEYLNFKILVCDNCSSDSTKQIVLDLKNLYPDKIEYIYNHIKGSAESNWNFLLQHLPDYGEYLALYHADDTYDSTIIRKQVDILSNNDVGASFTLSRTIDENDNDISSASGNSIYLPTEIGKKSIYDYHELLSYIMRYHNFIKTPSFLCKRAVLKASNMVFDPEFKSSADLDMWLRIAKLHKIAIVQEPLLNYRLSKSQGSYLLKQKRDEPADFFRVMDAHLQHESHKLSNYEWYEVYRNLDLIMCALNAIRNKNIDKAKDILELCLQWDQILKIIRIRFGIKQFVFGILLKWSIKFKKENELMNFLKLNS